MLLQRFGTRGAGLLPWRDGAAQRCTIGRERITAREATVPATVHIAVGASTGRKAKMPLSSRVAQFNRRFTNRLLRPLARWMPGFALISHTGRRSGVTYRTPINAFRTADGYRIALTYGPDRDWVRNVLAAGGCTLIVRGRPFPMVNPRLVDAPGSRWAPLPVRAILRRIGASQCLDLTSVCV